LPFSLPFALPSKERKVCNYESGGTKREKIKGGFKIFPYFD
jgi:hypothetical protein